MASYESEHPTDPPRSQRRPDLSSFLSLMREIAPDDASERAREGAVPVPGDISAAFRSLAEVFEVMMRENDGANTDFLEHLRESLMADAERPPKEVQGVDEEYIAGLERVNIKKLKKDADCPICGNPFIEDPHPLIVRLPCHSSHVFDMECIRPWLLLNGTCPMDRVNLGKQERERKQKRLEEIKRNAAPEDEEEEWDGMYG